MYVKDVYTHGVQSCTVNANVSAAACQMWSNDCGSIPVVDENGVVMGMITDRDICIALATRDKPARDLSVGEVISGIVHVCHPDDDVKTAMHTMRADQVRRLPVVDSTGTLLGVLSINDLILRAGETKTGKLPELSIKDVMSTLKAICEHRVATRKKLELVTA